MNGLKDRRIFTNVARGSQTETTDETRRKIREDITVQVWHNHDGVGEGSRVGSDLVVSGVENGRPHQRIWIATENRQIGHCILEPMQSYSTTHPQTGSVQKILVVCDIGVLFGDGPAGSQEHAVGHFP